jgi:hypothetical protein
VAANLQAQISGKQGNFLKHLKGDFVNGNVRVRSLPGQPAIPAFHPALPGDGCDQHCVASQAVRAFGQTARLVRKGPQLAGFLAFGKVSGRHNWIRRPTKSRKSPADTREIPVFGRQWAETRFDQHCKAGRRWPVQRHSVEAPQLPETPWSHVLPLNHAREISISLHPSTQGRFAAPWHPRSGLEISLSACTEPWRIAPWSKRGQGSRRHGTPFAGVTSKRLLQQYRRRADAGPRNSRNSNVRRHISEYFRSTVRGA